MLYDLLNMDLSTFDVRAIPHTAAKAHQQAHSFRGVDAWVHHILQEGAIGYSFWQNDGLAVGKADAYKQYLDFSKEQRDWKPDVKPVWSKKVRELLGHCVDDTRHKIGLQERLRALKFAPLDDCRQQFALRAGAPHMEWEPMNEEDDLADAAKQVKPDGDRPANAETVFDAPKVALESDTELGLGSDGAAGQRSENGGEPPPPLVPEKEPAQDELDDIEREPIEEESEDVEWELIEDEYNDVEWDPGEDQNDGA